MSELKPCPFCKSNDLETHESVCHFNSCDVIHPAVVSCECGASMIADDLEGAIELWQKRRPSRQGWKRFRPRIRPRQLICAANKKKLIYSTQEIWK